MSILVLRKFTPLGFETRECLPTPQTHARKFTPLGFETRLYRFYSLALWLRKFTPLGFET